MWYGAKAARFVALAELARDTRARKIPCVSPENGYFLYMQARAVRATRVLEIGTATGVSTLYLAEAVRENGGGHIDTVEKNARDAAEAKSNYVNNGVDVMISVHEGNALELLRAGLEGPYDLIFVDAMKREYGEYVEAALERLAPGGMIICDDVVKFGEKMTSLWPLLEARGLTATIVPTDPDDGVLLILP